MMNATDSNMAANAICHAAEMTRETLRMAIFSVESELLRPSTIYKPKLFIDGNQWCALLGENLHEGIAGFGASPDKAMRDFDVAWHKALAAMGGEEG